ncbi:unnamed protein product, partial [Rotaria socialis]
PEFAGREMPGYNVEIARPKSKGMWLYGRRRWLL